MPNGGQLTIETSRLALSPAEAIQFSEGITRKDIAAGPLAVLTISDSGVGMSHEIQPHIFEPFFTTKGKGKSTGLGLSTVYGIARLHGGDITVYSNPGTGSTFALYLPLANAGARAGGGSESPTRIRRPATVLLLEEDPLSRGILAKALQGCGYAVLETENAKLALDLAQDGKTKLDLLICDLFLAGTDGRKFADNLKRIHPSCKVLFLSGYPATHLMEQGLLKQGESLIARPFAASVIEPMVSDILAR
jgi:CheY-like chemotaxis protein